jgi:hypothetical protein
MVLELNDRPSRRYAMRRTVLVVACLALLAAPAWAGGGFHLFGTYGQINEWTETTGVGARLSVGGERVIFDLTATWFKEQGTKIGQEGGINRYDDLQIAPIEAGVRYVFAPGSHWRPYIGAGVSYFVTDAEVAKVDDEVGYYGMLGLLWHGEGGFGLYGEVLYRRAEVTYRLEDEVSFSEYVGGLAGSFGVIFTF